MGAVLRRGTGGGMRAGIQFDYIERSGRILSQMKMKRWLKFSLFALIGFLLFAAYSILFYSMPVYHYESSDRGMADIEVPWKGRTLATVEADFEKYKQRSEEHTSELQSLRH